MAHISNGTYKLNVAVYGVSSHMQSVMEIFFTKQNKIKARLANEQIANIGLFDLDNTQQAYKSYQQKYPERPVIVLAFKPPQDDACIFIRKPFCSQDFMTALLQAQNHLHQKTEPPRLINKKKANQHLLQAALSLSLEEEHARQVWNVSSNNSQQLYYQEQDYLYALVRNEVAQKRGQVCVFKFHNWTLAYHEVKQQIFISLDDKELYPYATMQLIKLPQITWYDSLSLPALPDLVEKTPQSLDAFLWKTCVWAARGRLPEGTDCERKIRLKYWPNVSRLYLLPHTLRILALWNTGAYSLQETQMHLNIPSRYVYACYNAVRSLDLLEGEVQPYIVNLPPRTETIKPAPPPPRQFLQHLLARLFLHKKPHLKTANN